MKNYSQSDDVIALTVPSGGVVGGNGYLIGQLFGVAVADNALVGDVFELKTRGVAELPKAAGAVTEGQVLYWDNTAKNVTTTATSNKSIGHAAAAQLTGDATVLVRLQTTTA